MSLPLLAACGTGGTGPEPASDPGDSGADAAPEGQLGVIASFYPLEYLVERIVGGHAEVSALTSPGVDPHDVELTPRTIGALGSADLVVYQSDMQPAVDDAVASQAADRVLDVTPVADLLAVAEDPEGHAEHAHGDGHTHDDHAHEDGDPAHDHGAEDPHFWLDPERYADVAVAIGDQLAQVDPANQRAYRENTADLVTDLRALDEQFAEGLASCESRDVVTTHDAFGYLGHRYDLRMTGITGISADSEPSPARLAEVAAQVESLGVTTLFTEPLLPSGIAETVARETGAQVLTLDPVEGITDASAGEDYLQVMGANLEALGEGLGCS